MTQLDNSEGSMHEVRLTDTQFMLRSDRYDIALCTTIMSAQGGRVRKRLTYLNAIDLESQ